MRAVGHDKDSLVVDLAWDAVYRRGGDK
jgi:hypothetical protein